jgi:hypothetical protein
MHARANARKALGAADVGVEWSGGTHWLHGEGE